MKAIPEQRQTEFGQLERLAMGYLAAPHSVPKADDLGNWRFLLRLWHLPAFGAYRSWGLYRHQSPASRQVRSLVRQVTWGRPGDDERLSDPLEGLERGYHIQPTIETRDRPLVTEELNERLAELGEISFPVFGGGGLGIDGELFGIERPIYEDRVQWWCEGPESWKGLTFWASSMREWLATVADEEPRLDLWKLPKPKLP
jgi:hypothetical protein